MDSERRELHAIPMSYIEKLFRKETWEHKFNLKQLYFRIPRDGASSIYLNCYTTMSQDEERRIKQEDAKEAEKESVEAEGSKKKRLLSSGEAIATAVPKDETPVIVPQPSLLSVPEIKIDDSDNTSKGADIRPPAIMTTIGEKKQRVKSKSDRATAGSKKANESPIDEHIISRRQSTAIRA